MNHGVFMPNLKDNILGLFKKSQQVAMSGSTASSSEPISLNNQEFIDILNQKYNQWNTLFPSHLLAAIDTDITEDERKNFQSDIKKINDEDIKKIDLSTVKGQSQENVASFITLSILSDKASNFFADKLTDDVVSDIVKKIEAQMNFVKQTHTQSMPQKSAVYFDKAKLSPLFSENNTKDVNVRRGSLLKGIRTSIFGKTELEKNIELLREDFVNIMGLHDKNKNKKVILDRTIYTNANESVNIPKAVIDAYLSSKFLENTNETIPNIQKYIQDNQTSIIANFNEILNIFLKNIGDKPTNDTKIKEEVQKAIKIAGVEISSPTLTASSASTNPFAPKLKSLEEAQIDTLPTYKQITPAKQSLPKAEEPQNKQAVKTEVNSTTPPPIHKNPPPIPKKPPPIPKR